MEATKQVVQQKPGCSTMTLCLHTSLLRLIRFLATNNLTVVPPSPLLARFSTLQLLSLPKTVNKVQGSKIRDCGKDIGGVAGGTKQVVKGELPGMLPVLPDLLGLFPDLLKRFL